METDIPPRHVLEADLHKLADEWTLNPDLSNNFIYSVFYNLLIGNLKDGYGEIWTIELDPNDSGMYVAQQHAQ